MPELRRECELCQQVFNKNYPSYLFLDIFQSGGYYLMTCDQCYFDDQGVTWENSKNKTVYSKIKAKYTKTEYTNIPRSVDVVLTKRKISEFYSFDDLTNQIMQHMPYALAGNKIVLFANNAVWNSFIQQEGFFRINDNLGKLDMFIIKHNEHIPENLIFFREIP